VFYQSFFLVMYLIVFSPHPKQRTIASFCSNVRPSRLISAIIFSTAEYLMVSPFSSTSFSVFEENAMTARYVSLDIFVFSQYRFLNKSVFGESFYAFRNRYFDMVGYGNHTPKFKAHMRDEFLDKMHSIAFRVTKDECLDLPDITEEIRMVELESKAMKLYKQLEKESYTELADSEVSAVNVLTKLLRLSQLTGGYLTDDNGNITSVSTAKLNALSDIIDSAMEENKKLVIMARFVKELDAIQGLLNEKGINYASVRGGVKDRGEEVRRFQEEPDCRVFIGQIAAAGMGLTLTAASTMVFYSLDYSMSNFVQAKARIHRVSQTENCHYIYLVAKDTVDNKVINALQNKVDLAKALVDDYRNGINPFKLNEEF